MHHAAQVHRARACSFARAGAFVWPTATTMLRAYRLRGAEGDSPSTPLEGSSDLTALMQMGP
jgi:hypothetical protein